MNTRFYSVNHQREGVLMPASAEVYLMLFPGTCLRSGSPWMLSGVLALDKMQGMFNFLASPLKWEHGFFGLFRGKV